MFLFLAFQVILMEKTITITGMHCKSCSELIKDVLSDENVTVRFDGDKAKLEYDESKISKDEIVKLIEENGYGVR